MLILGTLSLTATPFSSPDYAVPMLIMWTYSHRVQMFSTNKARLNLNHAKFAWQ